MEGAKSFQEREHKYMDAIKKKQDLVKEEREEKELKECTFAPRTLRPKERRTLDDFLKDQQKHLDRKKDDITKMAKDSQEKEEASLASLPKINEKSKVLKKDQPDDKPAYERLFAMSKNPIGKSKRKIKAEEDVPSRAIMP